MSWGKAIPLVFVFFAGFICTLVFRMSRQHIDLVRDDYYQDEIAYQQHIDRVNNARQKRTIDITYQPDQQRVVFALSDSLQKGEITFYRPADREQDFSVPVPAQHAAEQIIPTGSLAKGYWRVQFSWSDGQREYYTEKQIHL
ncbi:FixH family protein [Spirosoma fluminis]